MDKQAFRSIWFFMRRNWKTILLLTVLMFGVKFGEQQLSDALWQADLKAFDYGLVVVRLVLQTTLSTILVFLWHKQHGTAAPFSVADILKLFVTSLTVTIALTLCKVLIVTIPLAVWLCLRTDFYMNEYITGRSNGVFSCIGSSFRRTKGFARPYLIYNLKYLLFFILVEFAVTAFSISRGVWQSVGATPGLDVFDAVFTSVLMPYRFLLKCGFYSAYLDEKKEKRHG